MSFNPAIILPGMQNPDECSIAESLVQTQFFYAAIFSTGVAAHRLDLLQETGVSTRADTPSVSL